MYISLHVLPVVATMPRNWSDHVQCRHHPDANLVEDYRAGDMICSECGLVVGDRVIDVSSEWRTFSNDNNGAEDRCRVGGPENPLLESDLSTMIGPPPTGGSPYSKHHHKMSSTDRSLIKAFGCISNMADRISLPKSITDQANAMFKIVYEGRSLKGRAHEAIASACLYIACRQEGTPRTFKEIAAISAINKREIGRCFKLIIKAHETNPEIITSEDFIERFCGHLDLPRSVRRAAAKIAQLSAELDIAPGRSPISVAAAAIYMASHASPDKKSHREIAEIAGVGEGTIKQSYRLMRPWASELFPDDFVFFTMIENLPRS